MTEHPLAVVTGGSRGLGAAIAAELGARGVRIVLLDLTPPAEALPAGWRYLQVDVADRGAVAESLATITDDAGHPPDILVNNAGTHATGASADLPQADWQRVIDVNLTGAWNCSQVFGAAMVATGRGSIVNISSINASVGMPGRAAYSAAKAGLLGLTRVLAVEWAPMGVRVNAVQPGYLHTDLIEQAVAAGLYSWSQLRQRIPLGALGMPAQVATAVAFLVSSEASYITGQSLIIDGGYVSEGSVVPGVGASAFRPDTLTGHVD
ncbi:MAG: SDR family oxidoreductase [Actinomycetales bacterium]|nr:SDR family oxidoreductase [Actinomycetales bacterium]